MSLTDGLNYRQTGTLAKYVIFKTFLINPAYNWQ